MANRRSPQQALHGFENIGAFGLLAGHVQASGHSSHSNAVVTEDPVHGFASGYFALLHLILFERKVFASQHVFANRRTLCNWLRVGARWCLWCPGERGGIVPIALPCSLATLRDGRLKPHLTLQRMQAFVASERAARFLWPNMTQQQRLVQLAALQGKASRE